MTDVSIMENDEQIAANVVDLDPGAAAWADRAWTLPKCDADELIDSHREAFLDGYQAARDEFEKIGEPERAKAPHYPDFDELQGPDWVRAEVEWERDERTRIRLACLEQAVKSTADTNYGYVGITERAAALEAWVLRDER